MEKIFSALATSVTALLLTPGLAGAVDFAFQARAETGLQYYDFEQSAVTDMIPQVSAGGGRNTLLTTSSTRRFKDTMPILGIGGTVFADRFFFDASYQKAFNGSDSDNLTDTWSFPASIDFLGQSSLNQSQSDGDFDREEGALSIGYSVTEQFSVYGGWKWAKTEFKEKRNGTFQIDLETGLDPSTSFDVVRIDGNFHDSLEYDFKNNGPFIGAAYGWTINSGKVNGSLVANVAIAYLNGEFDNLKKSLAVTSNVSLTGTDGISNPVNPGELGALDEYISDTVGGGGRSFDGNSTGITFGLAWRGQTQVDGLAYLVGVNGYSYSFDADNKGNSNGGDVQETVINFRLGLSYAF